MKMIARPLRENGTERMGTDGVLSGDYKNTQNFIRYNLRKNAKSGIVYNVYRVTNGVWKLTGRHYAK